MTNEEMNDQKFREEVTKVILGMETHMQTKMGKYDEEKKKKMTDLLTFCISLLRVLPQIREDAKPNVAREFILWLTAEIGKGPRRWESLMLATALEETVGDQIKEMILQEELREAKENGNTIQ